MSNDLTIEQLVELMAKLPYTHRDDELPMKLAKQLLATLERKEKLREALEWIDGYIDGYCIIIHPKKTLSCITPEEAIRARIRDALAVNQPVCNEYPVVAL